MDGYSFWQDVFDTYQSLSNGVQLAWLIVPCVFLLGLVAIVLHYRLHYRLARGRARVLGGVLGAYDWLYTIHRDGDGFRVYQHAGAADVVGGAAGGALYADRPSRCAGCLLLVVPPSGAT